MGSYSDIQRQQTACQELLKKDDIFSGFLRGMTSFHKLCGVADQTMNRRAFAQRFTSLISCDVCYVVIYEGFLYVYKSETANKPTKVFDLCTFQRVEKDENLKIKGLPWPLKIYSDSTNIKALYFGASSEPEMKKWMEAVKKGIDEAKKSGRNLVNTERRMKKPEKQPNYKVIEDKERDYASPDDPTERDQQDLSIKDSVEEIEEAIMSKNPLPKEPQEDDLVREATWTGPLEESTEIMKSVTEEGIFMIRDSTTGKGEQTLLVRSDDAVRKYRITKEGDKLRIAGGSTFSSMTELLSFYQKNSIPNRSTKLTKPYSKV